MSTELPNELLEDSNMNIPTRNTSVKRHSEQPSYSCLKNGSRPTYREWKRNTQKNLDTLSSKNESEEVFSDRELALQKVKENFKASVNIDKHIDEPNNVVTAPSLKPKLVEENSNVKTLDKTTPSIKTDIPTELKTEKELKINASDNSITLGEHSSKATPSNSVKTEHRIKTKKYKLGKNKTHKLVGVLIKNRDTRKKISKEKDNLKKKSIIEVKNYLKKYNLLKSGSDAPADVLRTMYEQAILTGEINNKGKDNLLHNFYNK